jgi:thioredoxin reductase (NADPH)
MIQLGEGNVILFGTKSSSRTLALREFLTRNGHPFTYLDIDTDVCAGELMETLAVRSGEIPVVYCNRRYVLRNPSIAELAACLDLNINIDKGVRDVLVIGAGPAGLAVAVYAASEGLKTLVVEKSAPGGQAGSSSKIENYLGFPSGLSGEELAKRAFLQATRLGAEFLLQRVTCIRSENNYQIVVMNDGQEITCHVCLVATGVDYCMLDVPGSEQYTGAGVYYGAALSEAMGCANETVYIVGGANSAGQAAMHFSRYADKVHMVVRAESLAKSMSKYLIDQIEATPNIVVETRTEIVSMSGNDHLESLTLRTPRGEEERRTSSLFIFIGAAPKTDWLPQQVACDNKGFILAGPDLKSRSPGSWKLEREPYLLETSVPGIFVAGDVRYNSVKRCASAVGEGSIAIQFVHQYLATL